MSKDERTEVKVKLTPIQQITQLAKLQKAQHVEFAYEHERHKQLAHDFEIKAAQALAVVSSLEQIHDMLVKEEEE